MVHILLNPKKADPDDKPRLQRALKFSMRHQEGFNGFHYDENLSGPDGMSFNLLVPPGTNDDDIRIAMEEAESSRDMVSFYVTECPQSWFEEVESEIAADRAERIGKLSDNHLKP